MKRVTARGSPRPGGISRRQLLEWSGAGALVGFTAAAAAEPRAPTPAQTSGPFYPLDKPLDRDADLTLIRGHKARASGQVVHVMGRVLDVAGDPVPGARIEVWQANTHGRYTHQNDSNTAPLDPHFEGFASLTADADGRYRFKTIKPGAYPAGSAVRPPHIHFDIHAGRVRLVTQMYFPGDPRNDNDPVIRAVRDRRDLLVADVGRPTPDLEPDSWLARWDIVLATG
jgi:protocatechuate 3,4-dioxygenase beta subunit